MELSSITIFIAQAAVLIILIFASISYLVYKVKSRKQPPVHRQSSGYQPVPVAIHRNDLELLIPEHSFALENPRSTPVFARMQASTVHQRVTSSDLLEQRVPPARMERPTVVRSSFEQPKEKVQIARNWA